MAFCKLCPCGEKIVFERIMSFPDNCPACGRNLIELHTYTEDELAASEAQKTNEENSLPVSENDSVLKPVFEGDENISPIYALRLSTGEDIVIPEDGCIIGRSEKGAELLAGFPSVSRQHLRVTPRRIGVFVEDLSTYGTLVEGQRIVKNSPVRVAEGTKITLCNVEMVLIRKGSNES